MQSCTSACQGAHWSRSRHSFVTHDATPPTLSAAVRPEDIPALSPAELYAVYSDTSGRLSLLSGEDSLQVLHQLGCLCWQCTGSRTCATNMRQSPVPPF